jgi:hypothetical protein
MRPAAFFLPMIQHQVWRDLCRNGPDKGGCFRMTERYTATDVLAKIDQERTDWEMLLAEIGEERMETPGASGDWTVKDVIAHISGWDRPHIAEFTAVLEGEPMPEIRWPGDYNETDDEETKVQAINNAMYQQSRDQSLEEVLAESRGQWDDLRRVVTGISEDQLNDPATFPGLKGKCLAECITSGDWFSHYHDEHEQMLRDWLEEQRLR